MSNCVVSEAEFTRIILAAVFTRSWCEVHRRRILLCFQWHSFRKLGETYFLGSCNQSEGFKSHIPTLTDLNGILGRHSQASSLHAACQVPLDGPCKNACLAQQCAMGPGAKRVSKDSRRPLSQWPSLRGISAALMSLWACTALAVLTH